MDNRVRYEREQLMSVTEKEFADFMDGKMIKRIQGETFHSEYFEDENGQAIGYIETSSWNSNVMYMIRPNYVNQPTTNAVTEMLRQKS